MASSTPRPPLLPWSASTWADRWSTQGRLSSTPVPRTPFLLLKAPVSTLYEEKFGGDRNMFTGKIKGLFILWVVSFSCSYLA